MASIHRVRCRWSGFVGSPGFSNFYWNAGVLPDLGAIRAFFESSKAYWPSGVSVQVENTGDTLTDTSGALIGSWSNTAVTATTSTGTGSYAGAAGAVVHWLTDLVHFGRRLRGRTFVVPLNVSAYDTSGSLSSTFQTTLSTGASTLVTAAAGNMMVWGRPIIDPQTKAITRNGTSAAVNSSKVPDLAVSLRSRRD